jgi:dipeptidyl aminopeptidase/acylaminoacyl peptidase
VLRFMATAFLLAALQLLPGGQIYGADGPAGPAVVETLPRPIPLPAFAAPPTLADPTLSPDGEWVAATFRRGRVQQIVLHGLRPGPDGAPRPPRVYSLGDAGINWVRWASARQVVISIRRFDFFLPSDRLLLLDRETGEPVALGPKRAGTSGDDVIFWAPDGSHLLLSVASAFGKPPDVLRVDLPTNIITKVQKRQSGIYGWFANSRGEVVAGIGRTTFGKLRVIYRERPDERFRTVLKIDPRAADAEASSETAAIVNIDGLTQRGHVLAYRGRDHLGLYEYDFGSGEFGEAVFAHDESDVFDVGVDREFRLRWVSWANDRRRLHWLDDELRTFYADLERAVPDKVATVAGESADGTVKLIHTRSPTDPGSYYVYTEASGKMALIARGNEALRDYTLAPMTYGTYRARDGLEIPAYVTWPPGRERRALPLIVMPHGGPFARDLWEYNFLVQYLSNRGYVVLQPNFRGSTGYGKAFMERGYQQLGKAMQDDLDDGAGWLVMSGQVDPRRVCMVGWSYGGYAAQVAAYRNPGIYRCAVSIAGISDLPEMVRYDERVLFGPAFKRWQAALQGDLPLGDLAAVSPRQRAAEVRAPLLLVHGTADYRVPVRQSTLMGEALAAAGRTAEVVTIDGGDHSLSGEDQRLRLLESLDRFLEQHNPAQATSQTVARDGAASD